MKKLLDAIKKIIKHPNFKAIIFMQVVLILGYIYIILHIPKPVSEYEPYSIRIYSPRVYLEKYDSTIFDKHDSQTLTISSGKYKLYYSDAKGRNSFSDPPVIELLSDEEYLDITYIITDKGYKIVELHGVTRTYYTIEDHYSDDREIIVTMAILILVIEAMFILVCAILIDEMLHGPRYHRPRKLFKKHPADKHVYDDGEENEFSPYKQKLLEKEREAEANDK